MNKRAQNLSPMQKKMFETLMHDPLCKDFSEDQIDELIVDIKRMNAAELSQNTKIFHETNQTLGYEV